MPLTQQRKPTAVPAWMPTNYWPTFRRDVFTLLHQGYAALDHSQLRDAEEEDITGDLVRMLEDVLNDPGAPAWYDKYSVHEEPRVHAPDRKGKRRRRLDLRFERTDQRPRPHYEFEAKRLCRRRSGVADYLGVDGLSLILGGEYAAKWPEAGMLGYLQSNDVEYWQRKLADKVGKKLADKVGKKLDLRVVEGWQAEIVVSELCTYRSKHQRTQHLKPITIYHLLLPFEFCCQ